GARKHLGGGLVVRRRVGQQSLRKTVGERVVAPPAHALSRTPARPSGTAVDARPEPGAHHPPSAPHPGRAGSSLPVTPARQPAAAPAGPWLRPPADPDADRGPARPGFPGSTPARCPRQS